MDDDLADAEAAIEWSIGQIQVFERRLDDWIDENPCSALINEGESRWEITHQTFVPPIINAEAGAISNSSRSSLDLLASALAARNGITKCRRVYFPVCETLEDWTKNGTGGAEKVKFLGVPDQIKIETFQPYHGGDHGYLLLALHQMDIARKHRRLLRCAPAIQGLVVSRLTHGSSAKALPLQIGYKLARDEPNLDYQVQTRLEVTLPEAAILKGKPAAEALRQLTSVVSDIVSCFSRRTKPKSHEDQVAGEATYTIERKF